MSFCYINEGYKKMFNLITNDTDVIQVESSIFNPDSVVGCKAVSTFGILLNESIVEFYGKFSFYVDSSNPNKSVLKMSFYNIDTSNNDLQIPNVPICYLEAYPSDFSLSSGYFPFIFNINRIRIFASSISDTRQCAKVNTFNTIWLHIKLVSSGYSTFEIRVNENPIYTYSFRMSVVDLGNAVCFDLGNDTILSNIILSDSSIDPSEKIIPLSKSFVSGTAEVIDDTYRFTADGQNVKFSLSNNNIPNNYNFLVSRIACRITPVENVGSKFKTVKFRDTAISQNYSSASIPDVGSTHTFVANINKESNQVDVSQHSTEIVLNT